VPLEKISGNQCTEDQSRQAGNKHPTCASGFSLLSFNSDTSWNKKGSLSIPMGSKPISTGRYSFLSFWGVRVGVSRYLYNSMALAHLG